MHLETTEHSKSPSHLVRDEARRGEHAALRFGKEGGDGVVDDVSEAPAAPAVLLSLGVADAHRQLELTAGGGERGGIIENMKLCLVISIIYTTP